MIYVNSETILNNDRFFSPYMRKVIHSKGEKHLTITYIKILKRVARLPTPQGTGIRRYHPT